jgi:hypothetical protein
MLVPRVCNAANAVARGAVFWIVRPQVGQQCRALQVLTGPRSGAAAAKRGRAQGVRIRRARFAPVGLGMSSLKLVLRAERPRSSAPTRRCITRTSVGVVQNIEPAQCHLGDVHVLIYERYAGLVRQGSAF